MSGQPAARVGDLHTCPAVDPGPKPHVGGPILPSGEPTVLIGRSPSARITDHAVCLGPPDTITQGAFPVAVGFRPAARLTDATAHGGVIVTGCPTVIIGLAGIAGNLPAAKAAFDSAAEGRTSGSLQQSYNNCGVESSRQIINQATGAKLKEDELLRESIESRLALGTPGAPLTVKNGGTGSVDRQEILAAHSVASTVLPTTAYNMGLAMSRGQAVIVSLDAGVLWGPPTPPGSGHAVNLVGVEYDDSGDRTAVFINDTGAGEGAERVPVETFDRATTDYDNSKLNVTDDPVWW